jgi:hypothetical protein
MIVILSIPLIMTNILKYGSDVTKENFENNEEEIKDQKTKYVKSSSTISKKKENMEKKENKEKKKNERNADIADKVKKNW